MAKRPEEEQEKPKGDRYKRKPRSPLFYGERHQEQPRPKVPLLSGGKDPTLAERFEDELHRSS